MELTIKDESVYISRAVQVPSTPDQQIKANKDELMNRIAAFTAFKRRQVDVSNQLEFCQHNDSETTCARTDAVKISRNRHIAVQHVINSTGPNAAPPSSVDLLWARMAEAGTEWSHPEVISTNLVGLQERLEAVEEQTHSTGRGGQTLLQRIKAVETKLLLLEGQVYQDTRKYTI